MRQINGFKLMGLWGLMSDLVDVQKALVAQRWTCDKYDRKFGTERRSV